MAEGWAELNTLCEMISLVITSLFTDCLQLQWGLRRCSFSGNIEGVP